MKRLCILLLAGLTVALSACGGGGSSSAVEGSPQVAGNWQFTMTPTGNSSFVGSPLQGGFLLQNNGSFTGQIAFSIALPPASSPTICNSGTATVTGTVSGQTVSLTAVVGTLDGNGNPTTQTLSLTGGKLSSDNSTITGGMYSLTAGNYSTGSPPQLQACGSATDTGSWSATSVPPVTGGFQGFFHSTKSETIENQDFPVSGTLTQGANIGASSATINGTLVFKDPISLLNDYPCLTTASVNGTISGNTVLLQIFSTNGADVGQIGQSPGSVLGPVIAATAQGGLILQNSPGAISGTGTGAGYGLTTKSCPGTPGDSGNLCLSTGTACMQPITLTPFSLTFAPQLLGPNPTTTPPNPLNPQAITLTNNTSQELTGLSLSLVENDSTAFYQSQTTGGISGGDFNGKPHFSETDTCTPEANFSLAPSGQKGSSCTITVTFSPQESCPWLPEQDVNNHSEGIYWLPPAQCPVPLTAILFVKNVSGSKDPDNEFSVPITGTGLSFIVPSVPELDFGAEAVGEASPPQALTFTNQSSSPVSILPAAGPCSYSDKNLQPPQPRPPLGEVGGIQLAETADIGLTNSELILNDSSLFPPLINAPTVGYFCDTDLPTSKGGSGNPNFSIMDGCSGQTLQPFGQAGDSCSLQVTFVPQPATWREAASALVGLDDFLQLNTAWCGDANNAPEANCEIDSGRFPVEIKTNPASPLRMSPGAGMDFGGVTKGTTSPPLTITLFNDPEDPNSAAVSFASKIISGDYFETDTCGSSLAVNESCTITVTFMPKIVGLDPGSIIISYSTPSLIGYTQTIFMRGTGQ
jgi:hypothetical protein